MCELQEVGVFAAQSQSGGAVIFLSARRKVRAGMSAECLRTGSGKRGAVRQALILRLAAFTGATRVFRQAALLWPSVGAYAYAPSQAWLVDSGSRDGTTWPVCGRVHRVPVRRSVRRPEPVTVAGGRTVRYRSEDRAAHRHYCKV
jgi:hypothetical protein